MSVAILMTTYSGGRFLAEQIDSIIAQTYADWTLYVADDCSTDSTVSIIKSYADRDSRVRLLSEGVKRGARDGFMWLLDTVHADYYMFSDHDDVWNPDKIELSLLKMRVLEKSFSEGIPLCVGSDVSVASETLDVIHPSYRRYSHYTLKQISDKYLHLFYDNVLGCTMMINGKAKEVSLPYPREAIMHDAWVIAAVLWRGGRVGYIDIPTMLYRQHTYNHTGVRKVRSLWRKFFNLKMIMEKTRNQYLSSKALTNMNYLSFLFLKSVYMFRILWQFNVLTRINPK